MAMKYLSTPLEATGWENTLVNDSEGNTILLMPNGHKGLEATQEATALFAAAPDLLAVVCEMLGAAETDLLDDKSNVWRSAMNDARAAIAKAKGEA